MNKKLRGGRTYSKILTVVVFIPLLSSNLFPLHLSVISCNENKENTGLKTMVQKINQGSN